MEFQARRFSVFSKREMGELNLVSGLGCQDIYSELLPSYFNLNFTAINDRNVNEFSERFEQLHSSLFNLFVSFS